MTSPAVSDTASGPTMLRMLVGAQLRRLREERGITREQAGYEIRSSESKISRMELGRVSFRPRDVADLLTFYGIPQQDPERDRLLALVRQANAPGWWHRYGDLLPSWFQPYVGLGVGTISADIDGSTLDDSGTFLRLAVGSDIYITQSLAIIGELNWNSTMGDAKDLDHINFLLGLMWHF